MIFKNGFKNSSIFEDGLNNMFNSSLLAQTWGRPLQSPWCGGIYTTGNVKEIKINNTITWSTTMDHSKWAVSMNTNHSCFGDMNRMDSQWGRGGAFYCIKSDLLNQAMKSIIKTS
jgi:deoxyribonuclease-2